MEITKKNDNGTLSIKVSGRLDTNTSPELDESLKVDASGVKELRLDFKDLEYISSAGLRIILMYHKIMTAKGGRMIILHPTEEVMEVFDMTGFSSFLIIED